LKNLGVKRILYEGGEPLLHPQLVDILAHTHSMGFKPQIITNCFRLNKEIIKDISPYLDTLSVHLDTVHPDTFVKVQRFEKKDLAYSRHNSCMQGIQDLIDSGFNPADIELNIVLTKPIMDSLEETLHWAVKEMHIGMVILLPFHPIGQGNSLPLEDWLPSKQEIEAAFRMRAELIRPELRNQGTMDLCKYYCLTNFYIDIRGDVYPCSFVGQSFGNIYKSALANIMAENYRYISFADCVDAEGNNIVSGPCGDCEHSENCFGCRANADLLRNDLLPRDRLFSSDPLCWNFPINVPIPENK
jgi:radical SAM protein with 4Fe4S-binding SPASM domain